MKTYINKQTIVSFILGAIVLAFGYFVYNFYQMESIVAQDHAVLGQIVNLIQKSSAQAQQTK